MEFNKDQIRKTIFGNYKAEDVDRLLSAAEQLFRQQEEAHAAAAAQVKDELENARKTAAELEELREDAERLRTENKRLEERSLRLAEDCRAREDETRSLRGELDSLSIQMGEIRSELDLANSQTTVLSNRVARQRRELEQKDLLLLADPIDDANKRAEQIVDNAMSMSKEILDNAENMRTRALAAVRAAYFSAMGFRKDLESRYFSLQSDIDQSLRTLRAIDTENDQNEPDYVEER